MVINCERACEGASKATWRYAPSARTRHSGGRSRDARWLSFHCSYAVPKEGPVAHARRTLPRTCEAGNSASCRLWLVRTSYYGDASVGQPRPPLSARVGPGCDPGRRLAKWVTTLCHSLLGRPSRAPQLVVHGREKEDALQQDTERRRAVAEEVERRLARFVRRKTWPCRQRSFRQNSAGDKSGSNSYRNWGA